MARRPWSKAETHCAFCLRPFATEVEERRHFEQECEQPEGSCWCNEFCWIGQGGECPGVEGELAVVGGCTDEVAVVLALRAADEQLARARHLIHHELPHMRRWLEENING